jgi:hypothetical protein
MMFTDLSNNSVDQGTSVLTIRVALAFYFAEKKGLAVGAVFSFVAIFEDCLL